MASRMTHELAGTVPPRRRLQRACAGDAIGGIRVVKAFANESHEPALFARTITSHYRKTKLRGLRDHDGQPRSC